MSSFLQIIRRKEHLCTCAEAFQTQAWATKFALNKFACLRVERDHEIYQPDFSRTNAERGGALLERSLPC